MSGLFRRLSSRRSAGPEGTQPPSAAEPGAADAPTTPPGEGEARPSLLADPAAERRDGQSLHEPIEPEPPPAAATVPAEPPLPVADLPAGLDPDELAAVPETSARRSRLRRRVSFLRAAREVLLRDLGGFVYEVHRTAGDIEGEAHRRLRAVKLTRLSRLDAELHQLELVLDDVRRHVLVREPGVGGECPRCAELYGSDAHYCAHCGLPLTDSARRAAAKAVTPEPDPEPQPEPAAEAAGRTSVGRPTEELAAPPEGDLERRHPPREDPATSVEPSPSAPETPGDGSAGPRGQEPATPPDAAPAARPDEAPAARRDKAPAARPDEAPAARPDEAPAARTDEAPAARTDEAPAARTDEAPAARTDEAPAARAQKAPAARPDDAPPAGGEAARARRPAGAEDPTRVLGPDARNGRDASVFSPAERRP